MDEAKLLQKIIDLIPQPIFWKDKDLVYLGCNQSFARNSGLDSPAEVVGKTDYELSRAEEAEAFRQADQEVLRSGEAILEREEIHHQRDGKVARLLTSKVPLLQENGELLGVLATYADITPLKTIEEELRAHRNELERVNAELVEELERAELVQRQLLQNEAPPCDFLEIEIFRRPIERITGDFYSFRQSPGGAFHFLGADIVGHGISAALFTSVLKVSCQRAGDTVRAHPAALLRFLDRELKGEIPFGMFTAAAFSFTRVAHAAVRFVYSGAAHPPPILFSRADGQWRYLEKGAVAVGLLADVDRVDHTVTLAPGDRVFFYTDGFTEAVAPDESELGDEAFLELFRGSEHAPLAATRPRILDGLQTTGPGYTVRDDLTLIGFEVR